jgi:hypothetical protein
VGHQAKPLARAPRPQQGATAFAAAAANAEGVGFKDDVDDDSWGSPGATRAKSRAKKDKKRAERCKILPCLLLLFFLSLSAFFDFSVFWLGGSFFF